TGLRNNASVLAACHFTHVLTPSQQWSTCRTERTLTWPRTAHWKASSWLTRVIPFYSPSFPSPANTASRRSCRDFAGRAAKIGGFVGATVRLESDDGWSWLSTIGVPLGT